MITVAERVLPNELASRWRSKAVLFREHEETSLALAYEKCASELDEALRRKDGETLTLRQAEEECGYSADHLGRLVRDGKIPNAGRPGAPRITRGDLPKKPTGDPGEVAKGPPVHQVDNAQIVQSIIEQGE